MLRLLASLYSSLFWWAFKCIVIKFYNFLKLKNKKTLGNSHWECDWNPSSSSWMPPHSQLSKRRYGLPSCLPPPAFSSETIFTDIAAATLLPLVKLDIHLVRFSWAGPHDQPRHLAFLPNSAVSTLLGPAWRKSSESVSWPHHDPWIERRNWFHAVKNPLFQPCQGCIFTAPTPWEITIVRRE